MQKDSRIQTLFRSALCVLFIFLFAFPQPAAAYSVLSHEEIVDMAWTPRIQPLLLARFPGLTPDQLREAHSYAYGGCLIQDLGYYPFGNKFFSDLLHYVRTGDFVQALLQDAQTPDDLAFALGAFAHYTSDSVGHPYINRAVAMEHPKLRKKYGDVVTYEENPTAHIQTEFGFDVAEVAHERYSQDSYRNFIGFRVARPLLERAFLETYGFPLSELFKNEERAITTYRSAVSSLIPKMTKVALAAYGKQIERESPGFNHRKFTYRLRRTEFEREWGRDYSRPGWKTRFLAFLVRITPKIGPLRVLKPVMPNTQQQDEYIRSVNKTVDQYEHQLAALDMSLQNPQLVAAAAEPPLRLESKNLDTGDAIHFGQYRLADKTYKRLLDRYVEHDKAVLPEVVAHLAAFYSVPPAGDDKLKPEQIAKIHTELNLLKSREAGNPTKQ